MLAAPRGHRHGARKHHEAGDGTEKDQQCAFVTAPPSMADRGRAGSAWDFVVLEGGGGDVASRENAVAVPPRRNDLAQWADLRGAGGHLPRPRVRDGTVTPHPPLSKAFGTEGRSKPRIEVAILPTTRTRVKRAVRIAHRARDWPGRRRPQAKSLTAAVTGRMKIPSASQNDSVLSSSETVRPRRSPVSGIESTGGHTAYLTPVRPSRERTGLFSHRVRHERRRPPPARPERHDVHGAVESTKR